MNQHEARHAERMAKRLEDPVTRKFMAGHDIVYLLYRGFEGNKYLINVYGNRASAERQAGLLKGARRYDYWVESTQVRN